MVTIIIMMIIIMIMMIISINNTYLWVTHKHIMNDDINYDKTYIYIYIINSSNHSYSINSIVIITTLLIVGINHSYS